MGVPAVPQNARTASVPAPVGGGEGGRGRGEGGRGRGEAGRSAPGAPQEDCPLPAAIAPPAPPAILCPAQAVRRPEMGEGDRVAGRTRDPGRRGGGRVRELGKGGAATASRELGERAERRAGLWRAHSWLRPAAAAVRGAAPGPRPGPEPPGRPGAALDPRSSLQPRCVLLESPRH